MSQETLIPVVNHPSPDPDVITLGEYARSAYLEYALSVVKGRALPDVTDGQKSVQRRILYAMERMGLSHKSGAAAPKAVKSARVVGDVLGRYHPHGDQAAYDAMVRMAQDFSQRYPLVDGQGNFGSRDGDGAAAMRYTEARLAPITRLLLDEVDLGTVDFMPNYDGSTQEPKQLPARLPFALLNGASGIAVGMATEIPSHNLREVAQACVALLKQPEMSNEEIYQLMPGPDYPGGGQIISSDVDIYAAYSTGRGSLKVRARWTIEELARGQWQLVVTELPPVTSSQRVLEEIEELTNPKVKANKKSLTQDQQQLKATVLAVLDCVRDESSKDAAVRLVFEPKTSKISQDELINILLAQTSLEVSAPINMTSVGIDGKPVQKSLRQMLQEWIEFRLITVRRRSEYRLSKVLDRIHILEGRQLVLLNIDEVIAIIRESDEPKVALMERFKLSERQADDILDIRLRQLARLEAIKIEQELSDLRKEQSTLENILGSGTALRKLVIKEIEADAKEFGDERRTLIMQEQKAVLEVKVVDEPVTVVVSQKGWVRVRTGQGHDPQSFSFKTGDKLYDTFECRSVDTLLGFGSNGRVYSVPVASLPGARGDGAPFVSFIDSDPGTDVHYFWVGPEKQVLLLSATHGYGFLATIGDMTSRQRAGKAFITVGTGEEVCRPSLADDAEFIACMTDNRNILTFDISELKQLPNGGKGLMLIKMDDKVELVGAAAYTSSIRVKGIGRGQKEREEVLEIRSLNNAKGNRARKGRRADLGFEPTSIERIA
ncbi:MAG: DNA topoisomerase IV subunit A [Saezia sp.]